jgi:hypothetical protein
MNLTLIRTPIRHERKNVFARLMEAVKTDSLGQVSHALYEVGASTGGTCERGRSALRAFCARW